MVARDRSNGKDQPWTAFSLPFSFCRERFMPDIDQSTEELVRVSRWLRQHNPARYAALRERLRDLLGDYFAYIDEAPHTVAQ
jgi:hypothetical protein